MQVISVENLSKAYGTGENRTDVLHGVSFTVDEGEFVSVMGPSGCGKSTLLYLIGGLETPDGGACLTCGANLAALSDKEASRIRCRDVGFVFQFYNLVENLTVEENIILPLIMAGVRAEDCEERLTKLLDELSLTEKRKATPPTLSGGQQQRVAIARAVITEPKLLLADEPTGNLDSASGARVMELFDRIHRERGIAILMVTHSEEIASHGDRILHMADGKIIEC